MMFFLLSISHLYFDHKLEITVQYLKTEWNRRVEIDSEIGWNWLHSEVEAKTAQLTTKSTSSSLKRYLVNFV